MNETISMKIPLRKCLGQHILKDDFLDFEIDLAKLQKKDIVLEIGAGPGNLTRKLAQKARIIAVEKDDIFIDKLKIKNVDVIHGDITDILKKDIQFNKVVSNIPYYKSQEILLELLKHKWDIAVLCVQKEFAEKMTGNTKLGMLVRDCTDTKIIAKIGGDNFSPKGPDSAIVFIHQKKQLDEKFWKFLQHIYKQKNRDVKNVIPNISDYLAKKKIHQLTLNELRKIYKTKDSSLV